MIIKFSPQQRDTFEELELSVVNGQLVVSPEDRLQLSEYQADITITLCYRGLEGDAYAWPSPIEIADDHEGVIDYKSMLISCKPQK